MALAIVSFLELTGIFLNISIATQLRLFVFFGSISCYNFLKYGIEGHKYSVKANNQKTTLGIFSIISALIAFYLAFSFNIRVWGVLVVLLVLIILYAFPVYPHQKNLRSLGILKVLLVAMVWSVVTVLLPVIANLKDLNWDVYLVLMQRFIIVVVLMIPFEIRDMQFDPPNVRTLPRRIGVKNTKLLGVLMAFLSCLMVYLKDELYYYEIIGRIVFVIALSLLILKTPKVATKYYASFWIEALPVFWYGFMYFLLMVS